MPFAEHAVDAAVSQLSKYLLDQITKLRRVYREWPNPSIDLDIPSCSIFSTQQNVTPQRNSEISAEDITGEGIKQRFLYLAGYLDFVLQLDLWSDNKEERNDLAAEIFDAFHPEIGRDSGLSLTLEEYHNTVCRYELQQAQIQDTEDSATRSEWRYRFDLRCHCDLLIQKDGFKVDSIQLEDSEITDPSGNKGTGISGPVS
jgi:hypothetical protein